MTTYTCPQGHQSGSSDYCDTCGVPILTGAPGVSTPAPEVPTATPPVPATQECPNCGEHQTIVRMSTNEDLLCQHCGNSMLRPV